MLELYRGVATKGRRRRANVVVGAHRAKKPAMDNQRYSILVSKGSSCNVAIKSRVEPSLLVLYRDVATKSQRLNARHKKQQRAVLVKTLFNRQNVAIKPRVESSLLELYRGVATKGRHRRANVVVGVHRAESPAMDSTKTYSHCWAFRDVRLMPRFHD